MDNHESHLQSWGSVGKQPVRSQGFLTCLPTRHPCQVSSRHLDPEDRVVYAFRGRHINGKSRGPRTDPWNTPGERGWEEEMKTAKMMQNKQSVR